MLYQKQVTSDRSKTQLAYKLRYWPGHMLGTEARKFCTVQSPTTVTKQRLEDMLNEELTHIFVGNPALRIVWAFNNIPTEKEWTSKAPNHPIRMEVRTFRHASMEPVCILSMGASNNHSNNPRQPS